MAAHWYDRFISAPQAQRYLAGIESIGQPLLYKETDDQATQGVNIAPNVGVAHTKLALTKKSIPKPDDHTGTINFVKQMRSQFRVREQLQTLADQVTNGFRVKGTPKVKAWFTASNLYGKVNRIAFELASIGFCVAYVSESKNKGVLPKVTILHNVQVRTAVDGSVLVFLQLTEEAKEVVRANRSFYPANWVAELDNEIGVNITRVLDAKGKVISGGAYFITLECDSEDVFPIPPIYPALAHAMDSEKVLVGLGASLDFIKYYLLHVLMGNPEGQDMRDGRVKPVSKGRVSNALFQLSAGFAGGALVTEGDVTIEHNMPTSSPYVHHMDVVDRYSKLFKGDIGLPDYKDVSSEGVASYLAKMFLPKIDHLRAGIIEAQFLRPLLLHLADRVPGLESARIVWSNSNVQELKTLLDRAKFQGSTGGCSIQYLNEIIDPDYDLELELVQKEVELKSKDIIGMIYEPAQGLAVQALDASSAKPAPNTTEPIPVVSGGNHKKAPGAPGKPTN